MSLSFAVDVSQPDPATLHVRVLGELDLATVPRLRAACEPHRDTRPALSIVLDLSETRFADSTAIGLFLSLHRERQRAGARLVLRSPSPPVARVLRLVGLDQILTIEC